MPIEGKTRPPSKLHSISMLFRRFVSSDFRPCEQCGESSTRSLRAHPKKYRGKSIGPLAQKQKVEASDRSQQPALNSSPHGIE